MVLPPPPSTCCCCVKFSHCKKKDQHRLVYSVFIRKHWFCWFCALFFSPSSQQQPSRHQPTFKPASRSRSLGCDCHQATDCCDCTHSCCTATQQTNASALSTRPTIRSLYTATVLTLQHAWSGSRRGDTEREEEEEGDDDDTPREPAVKSIMREEG